MASATSILSGAAATLQLDRRRGGGSPEIIDWGWLFVTFAGLAVLQIAANLINDYGDFKKGADGKDRLGPPRVISMGWIKPSEIRRAIDITLYFELIFAIPLCVRGGFGVLILGIIGVIGAIWYTSGTRSLAYLGLGEVAVFLLFGPGAVLGTVLVQTKGEMLVSVFQSTLVPALIAGSFVSAILVVNNLRDIPTDLKAGKATLATRLGTMWTRRMYVVMILLPYLLTAKLSSLQKKCYLGIGWRFSLLTLPIGCVAMWQVSTRSGRSLNSSLGLTAALGTAFSATATFALYAQGRSD